MQLLPATPEIKTSKSICLENSLYSLHNERFDAMLKTKSLLWLNEELCRLKDDNLVVYRAAPSDSPSTWHGLHLETISVGTQ